ncbi:hypothetical protein [Paenibacillus radicis (ex Gao et al. 2016)]|uniref:Uncharacterized protein n=1 Tax=Paenibacillus radicis (ex Gao et al. 2016) TaxID=1737354 RepID=A0A917HFZ9_9BACL|nr:hypothetical protein [Paenibacillus radicis (ex Gao et al. 2016)]GGG77612.1 hypothetical protein GCM10010918_37940 [Paenibacillus radicis (ex Gao et al. 2016)]
MLIIFSIITLAGLALYLLLKPSVPLMNSAEQPVAKLAAQSAISYDRERFEAHQPSVVGE